MRKREKQKDQQESGAEAEARKGAFESARESEFAKPKRKGSPPKGEASQAPGGDSSPDRTDPAGAAFVRVDDRPEAHSTRTQAELPPIERAAAEELARTRSDDVASR
jgi:hypothetical protein